VNEAEALTLCRLVKGFCPQQAFDEYTPDAWFMVLRPYRFEDCRQAVVDLAASQVFMAPSEIIAGVKRIRGKRIAAFGPIDPPPGITDGEYQSWFLETRRRIGDGNLTRDEYVASLEAQGCTRELPALDNVFRKIGDDT
jgi:hypothetical protein